MSLPAMVCLLMRRWLMHVASVERAHGECEPEASWTRARVSVASPARRAALSRHQPVYPHHGDGLRCIIPELEPRHYEITPHTMALKRKRSYPTVSSPSTATSDATVDSPNTGIYSYYQHSKPMPALYEKPSWSFPTYEDHASQSHLNSRTRKRHRDDRPDDEEVYGEPRPNSGIQMQY